MGLGTFFGGAAVKELLRLSPQIITAAEQVYATVNRNRQNGNESGSGLANRIASLEAADSAQAELLERVAQQLQAQSKILESLAAQLRTTRILAIVALALSALLVPVILFWK